MGLVYASLLAFWCWFIHSQYFVSLLAWLHSFDPVSAPGLCAGPIATFCIFFVAWHGYGYIQHLLDSYPRPLWKQYKLHTSDTLGYHDMIPVVLRNQPQLLVAVFVIYWARGFDASLQPPSIPKFMFHLVGVYLSYEAIFYVTHRALHHPSLWRFHDLHHKTRGSVGVSGMYQSATDFFLTTTLAHVVGPVLLGPHCAVTWFVALVGGLNSIHSHGAYAFPGMPSPEDHNWHHLSYKVNFATGPLDLLLGTHARPPAAHTLAGKPPA